MIPRRLCFALLLPVAALCIALLITSCGSSRQDAGTFEVHVRLGPAHSIRRTGRLFVLFSREPIEEPADLLNDLDGHTSFALATDADVNAHGAWHLGPGSAVYPFLQINSIPPGEWYVQALLDISDEQRALDARGNLFSSETKIHSGSEPIRLNLQLDHVMEPWRPRDEAQIRYIRVRSALLSEFWGRDYFLDASVILPFGFERSTTVRYPVIVAIGPEAARSYWAGYLLHDDDDFASAWQSTTGPRFILIYLNNQGPYGSPYFVNSENNGPFGDALVHELIPEVESQFRGRSDPESRFLYGRSTGGWSALALQTLYPHEFNGAWAGQPDPVDFRSYVSMNIYRDSDAFLLPDGTSRPASRSRLGPSSFVQEEVRFENFVAPGGIYTRSALSWGAWNAVFAPRGPDGYPAPLWDPRTGQIDPAVAEHFKKYDLRRLMEKNWSRLGPAVRDKFHIWVGEWDNYYLEDGVHHLADFFNRASPPPGGSIVFGPLRDHSWSPYSFGEIMEEMADRVDEE